MVYDDSAGNTVYVDCLSHIFSGRMIQESTAQSRMTEEMMVYVWGICLSIVVFLDKAQSYAIYL